MVEQRLTIKAADLLTEGVAPGGSSVETVMLPVVGGKATVFGLLAFSDPRPDVREGMLRVVRTHLEQAAQSMAGDANIPRRFESALGDLNAALATIAEEYPTLNLRDFEAVIGVVTHHQLFTSGIGGLSAIYLHKTAERRFVIYELSAQFGLDEEASWRKPFVTVLDGELQPGDIFYVATRVPSQSIDLGELQDILVTLPPSGALQRIRQFLPHDDTYGALCFHVAEDERSGPPKKMNPIASLAALGNTKSETADLLGEQGGDVIGFVKRFANATSAKLAAPGARGYTHLLKRLLRAVVQLLAALTVVALRLLRGGFRLLVRIFDAASTKAGRVGPSFNDHIRSGVTRVRSISPRSRALVLSILGVVAVLAISIGFMQRQSVEKEARAAFASTVSRIEEKTTAAEASLIYDDVTQARKHLTEAAVLLETLAPDSSSDESAVNTLRTAIEAMSGKIRRMETVALTTVAELTDGGRWTSVVAVGGTLYGLTADKSVYRVNELEHAVTKESTTNGSVGSVFAAAPEGANVVFVDDTRQLGRVDLTAKTVNPVTSGVSNLASANDILVYNDALYVLVAASQQIVKMRAQGGSYEAGTTWISARASDLTSARAIAIDGNIYVLMPTDVLRFKSQRETAWEHETLDPALQNPDDIWTGIDSSYLYILEKANRRVVVYEKEGGRLVTQYTAPEFADAIGFVVREADNTVLVATPTKILSFPATHLLQ